MKTIFQNTEVAFNSISIQDAVIMIPVMDQLCEQRNKLHHAIEHDDFNCEIDEQTAGIKLIQVEDQIRILLKLGFCPSSPAMLQNFKLEKQGED